MQLEFFFEIAETPKWGELVGVIQGKITKTCMKIVKSIIFWKKIPQFSPSFTIEETLNRGSNFEIWPVLKNWQDQSKIFSEIHFVQHTGSLTSPTLENN